MKIGIYLFLLFGIVGVGYSIYYSAEVDEANRELDLVRPQVKTLEDGIASRKAALQGSSAQIELRNQAKAMIKAAEILGGQKETLRQEIKDLEQRKEDLADQFVRVVKRVRDNAVGTAVGDIALPLGRALKNCTVKSIDDEIMIVNHSEGIARVPVDDLPQELKDRFKFGVIRVVEKVTQIEPTTMPSSPGGKSSAESKKPASDNKATVPMGNPDLEGDPALWSKVTRTSLGRVFIPGTGWLKVGPKGPIASSAFDQR